MIQAFAIFLPSVFRLDDTMTGSSTIEVFGKHIVFNQDIISPGTNNTGIDDLEQEEKQNGFNYLHDMSPGE